jgi:glutathione synthase/RimK-type ligase-like ATP-grasp enzyme
MRVGLCTRMASGWLEEFTRACGAMGLEARQVAIGADDWMDQARGLDLFVWRLTMGDASAMAEARTKIPILESMGIPCFPNTLMLWLYDDKIRETFFMRQHGYPMPRTWVHFEEQGARAFAQEAAYPLVAKAHCGASAGGVMLLGSAKEAQHLLGRIFRKTGLLDILLENYYYLPRLAKGDVTVQLAARYHNGWPRYAYFQEFLHIDKDWRITTLGRDLVSIFVRKNRPDDFRASGSGIWEKVELADLPADACDLALRISNENGFTSMTYDFMRKGDGWVIGEISYAFMLNKIYSDTLFRREQGVYAAAEPSPIGEMHLRAMLAQKSEVALVPHP